MYEKVAKEWIKKEMRLYTTETESRVTSDALKSPIQRQRIDNALKLIGKVGLVLDVGCNDAYISKLIESQENECIGLDFPSVLRKARKDIQRVGAEWNHLPFKNESFHCLFLGEVIEHVVDLDPFMTELRRILKPKGKLVLTTPNIWRLRNRIEALVGWHTQGWHQMLEPVRHVRYFTYWTLKKTLTHYGFEVKKYAGGKSEGGNPDWLGFTPEEAHFIMKIISKFTPKPEHLESFIVVEAVKT